MRQRHADLCAITASLVYTWSPRPDPISGGGKNEPKKNEGQKNTLFRLLLALGNPISYQQVLACLKLWKERSLAILLGQHRHSVKCTFELDHHSWVVHNSRAH